MQPHLLFIYRSWMTILTLFPQFRMHVLRACLLLVLSWAPHVTEAAPGSLALKPSERAYLASLGTLKLCVDPNWLPFERLSAMGEHEGIFAEYLKLIANKLGISIEPVFSASWERSLSLFQDGHCQLMSGLNITPERLSFMLFSEPYLTAPMVIISRQGQPYVPDLAGLNHKTLASVEGYRIAQEIERQYPKIDMEYHDSTQAALIAVSGSRVDATVGSVIGMSYNVYKLGLTNLKIIGHTEFFGEYRIGVQPSFAALVPLLDKTIDSLPKNEKSRIINQWVRLMDYKTPDYTWFWRTLIAAALLTLFVAYRHFVALRNKKQLEYINQQLETAVKEQETLVKMVSHQYRTPLSILNSGLNLLRNEIGEPSEKMEYRLAAMDRATKRMGDTLDIALGQQRNMSPSNNVTVCKAQCLLSSAIHQALALAGDNFPNHRYKKEGVIDVAVTVPMADLVCCLDNLLSNAAKYSEPEAGNIVIKSTLLQPDLVRVTITDCGIGIAPEEQKQVFDKYFRGCNTASIAGSGLGLAIVKQLLQTHGGDIHLARSDRQGTEFCADLPIANSVSFSKGTQ